MSPAPTLDPNLTAARPDLAAAHLRGQVTAERYAEGVRHQAARGIVPLRGRPEAGASMVTELLFGETFTVYEARDGWAWGQCEADGYVGYAEAAALADTVRPATHLVTALRAFIYPRADAKAPPVRAISMGARLAAESVDGSWVALAGGGFVPAASVRPLGWTEPDHVATAVRFLGVPYLWGGRSSLGLDCSGLVQVSLAMAGIPAPRDSIMQAAAVGRLLADSRAGTALARGDLVFFPGHVGIMVDEARLVHANMSRMCVSLDALDEVERIVPVSAVRRL
jgi:cell wall-associated NlpC family hydrolase